MNTGDTEILISNNISETIAEIPDEAKGRYFFNVADDKSVAEVDLIGVIGAWWEGNDAQGFVTRLNEIKDDADHIIFNISGPGGLYHEGLTIYRAIRNVNAKTTARLSGMVASASSFISTAADTVEAAPETEYMYHGVVLGGVGNVQEWEQELSNAKISNDNLAAIYGKKSNTKTKAFFKGKINSGVDQWLSAADAKKLGLVDKIVDTIKTSNTALPSENYLINKLNYSQLPERVRAKYNISKMDKTTKNSETETNQDKLNALSALRAFAKDELVHVDKLNAATNKLTDLEKTNETLSAKKEALEAEIKALKESADSSEAEKVTALNAKVTELESANKASVADLDASKKANEALTAEISALKETNEKLTKANAEFVADTDGMVIDIESDREEAANIGKRKLNKWEQEEKERKELDAKIANRRKAPAEA